MAARLFAILVGMALVVVACSSLEGRPSAFDDMTGDEVGCVVRYGDTEPNVVGPLGPSDATVVEPNDYTSIRVARTASELFVVAERPGSRQDATVPLNDLPSDGIVARDGFIDSGNPGYTVTC